MVTMNDGNGTNGTKPEYIIELRYTGWTEPRDGHFAAHCRELGFTTYGNTADVATDRMRLAVERLIARLGLRGKDATMARFTELGAWSRIIDSTVTRQPFERIAREDLVCV